MYPQLPNQQRCFTNMNQAEVSKLMSALKVAVNPKARRLRNLDGPEGRLNKLRKTVTALIKHERIELNFNRADESRPYVERVINLSIGNPCTH